MNATMIGPTLASRAFDALDAHHMLLRALEEEPARQRDPADAGEASAAWCAWHDEVLQPRWAKRDAAVTPLLAHPDYERWHARCWRDAVTVVSRVPYVWRPVAVKIMAETAR